MADDSSVNLSLVYEGGMADQGELDFYEYSRAAYGFSRLVSTAEVYRRTGRIPQKITRQMGVDLVISASEKGSFPVDIIAQVIADAGAYSGLLSKLPLGVLIKVLIQSVKTLLPSSEDRIFALAQLELERDRQKTAQSKEETKRISDIRKIVESGNATTQAALALVQKQLDKPDTALSDLNESVASLTSLKGELAEILDREAELAPYAPVLEKIPRRDLAALSKKVRPQIAEIGLPLQRSAKIVKITEGKKRSSIAYFDERRIADIQARELDEDEFRIGLRVIYYDRDGGYGKCDIFDQIGDENPSLRKVSFSVGRSRKNSLRSVLLEAEDVGVVPADVRYYRDRGGNITSVLVEDVIIPLPE